MSRRQNDVSRVPSCLGRSSRAFYHRLIDGGLPRLAIFNANNEDVDQGLHENPSRKRKKTLSIVDQRSAV